MELSRGHVSTNELAGDRILVAEDELLIALDIGSILSDAGAEIVGPATTSASAMQLARSAALSGATLDVRLGRETTEAIALALSERDIPFVFYTGQSLPDQMRERWPDVPVIVKPAGSRMIVGTLRALLEARLK